MPPRPEGEPVVTFPVKALSLGLDLSEDELEQADPGAGDELDDDFDEDEGVDEADTGQTKPEQLSLFQ